MPETTNPYFGDYKYLSAPEERVPKVEYRCKAVTHKAGAAGDHTVEGSLPHLCRSLNDHERDHRCICGHTWPQVATDHKEKK